MHHHETNLGVLVTLIVTAALMLYAERFDGLIEWVLDIAP